MLMRARCGSAGAATRTTGEPKGAEGFFDFASRTKIAKHDFRRKCRDAPLRMTGADVAENEGTEALHHLVANPVYS